MIVTIIGGQGFIGQALVKHLAHLGCDCWIPEKNDSRLFERDLGNVFYCAGLTADYLQRPFDTVNAHVNLLSQILERASWNRLVYLSSTRVYDGLSGVVDESHNLIMNPNNPRHLYDLSKLMGESLCLQTRKASVARLSCVYQDETDADGFLPHLLRQVIQHPSGTLRIDSSPNYTRDYVHLSDVIDALIAIMNGNDSSIYNVASGENISNHELFSKLTRISGINIVPMQAQQLPEPPVIRIKKMEQVFGWSAKKTLPTVEHILRTKKA